MYELYCGDCMTLLKKTGKVKYLLTDIPYDGVNRESNGLRTLDKGAADVLTFNLDEWLDAIYPKADIFTIFCGINQLSQIYNFFDAKRKNGTVRIITWCKTNPSPLNGDYVYLSGVECAVWFRKKGNGKLNCHCKKNWFVYPTTKSKFHPTEKPQLLLKELIEDNTSIGDTVLDCCMGGGSTGICAVQLGRNFIGMELNTNYFNAAKQRIESIIN